MKKIIKLFLRLIGINYQQILKKIDFVLLKDDKFTHKGIRTYDNGAKVWRWTETPLKIGKYCSIAYDVNFIVDEGYHSISLITNFPLLNSFFKDDNAILGKPKNEYLKKFTQKEGITIENDVWIGMGAFIMPGVKIGNGATIAANSVVTRDVPDYTIVAGVPARIISNKHNSALIKELNNIAWWDWEESLVKERIADFYGDINDFINKYKK